MAKKSKEEQEKEAKERQRKRAEEEANVEGTDFDDMLAYVDEYGNIVSTPPDPSEKDTVDPDEIVVGVPKKEELAPEDIENKGRVKFFNEEKGFGFIKDNDEPKDLFFHVSDCEDDVKENDKVVYEIEKTPKGLSAKKVKLQ